eukprot:27311_1
MGYPLSKSVKASGKSKYVYPLFDHLFGKKYLCSHMIFRVHVHQGKMKAFVAVKIRLSQLRIADLLELCSTVGHNRKIEYFQIWSRAIISPAMHSCTSRLLQTFDEQNLDQDCRGHPLRVFHKCNPP